MGAAWKRIIAETLEEASERLHNRSLFLRSAGLREESHEAQLCANVVREMIKEIV